MPQALGIFCLHAPRIPLAWPLCGLRTETLISPSLLDQHVLVCQEMMTMSSRTSSPATSALVADQATQTGALHKSGLGLLGLFGAEGDLRAMIRLPNGRVKTVQKGSRISRSKVLGIDAKGVLLESSGQTRRIEMPGS